jgi:YD repeat-containing protein
LGRANFVVFDFHHSADKSDTVKFTYTEPVQVMSAQVNNSFSVREEMTYLSDRLTYSKTNSVSTHYTVNVKEIIFKKGKVVFEYVSDRLDLSNARRLNAIEVFELHNANTTKIRRFNLVHDYFTAASGQTSQVDLITSVQHNKRLKLQEVYEEGIEDGVAKISKPAYSFKYDSGAFPLYATTAQDFMGFYNGAHDNDNLLFYGTGLVDGVLTLSKEFGADREINPATLQAGVLKKIIYPTGGFSVFELEPNQIVLSNGIVYTGGLRIKYITSDDGFGQILKRKYNYPSAYFNTSLFSGDISAMAEKYKAFNRRYYYQNSQWVLYDYSIYAENFTFQIGSSTNTVASYSEVEEYIANEKDKPLGKTVSIFNTAQDNIPSMAPDFRSDEEWRRSQLLRQKIYKTDPEGKFILLKETINQYDYQVIDIVSSYSASLFEEGNPPDVAINVFRECNIDVSNQYHYGRFDQMVHKSNLTSTLTIQYDENGNNADSSQTLYSYDNSKHYQLMRMTQESSGKKILTSNFKYPLDLSLATCDEMTCYTNYKNALNDRFAEKLSCESTHYTQYQSTGSTTDFDAYLACNTTYQNQVSQTVVPDLYACKASYDDCIESALATANNADKSILIMQRDSVINKEIENASGVILNGTEYITSAVRSDFKPVNHGAIAPEFIWTFNSVMPITKADFDQSSSSYYRKTATFSIYDSQNNIVQKSQEDDAPTSYIWDYHSAYPIAEVVNAHANSIAHTSFEADGTGNFGIDNGERNIAEARTGSRSYSLSNGSISKSGLAVNIEYIISFWAKSGAVSLNGQTLLPASSEVVDGWEYYEAIITGTSTTSVATITGNALIDELRFFRKGAQMTTYCYDPLTGVTSQTDQNNRTTKFEYDALGRLTTVKDSHQNVVKAIMYNYKTR